MYKKTLTVVLILAFLNLLAGCYTSEKLPAEGVYIMNERIISAILTDGQQVIFDKDGGAFHQLDNVVVGKTVDNKTIIQPLTSISEFRKNKVRSYNINEIGTNKIKEVVGYENRLYKFNEEGGVYDSVDNLIKGITPNGERIGLKQKYIDEIHLNLPETINENLIVQSNEPVSVSQIVLKNSNRIINLGYDGIKFIPQLNVVSGSTTSGETVHLGTSDVLYVKVERTDVAGTVLASLAVVVGILGVIIVIAIATKQSCPFVYSYDGDQYVFDAEPLGGAVTRGLQRTDLSKLDHLKEVDGKYKLLVRNEVPETQYLDKMSLVVVDHPENTEIVTDLKGNLHTIKSPLKPIYAEDENGKDLTNFVSDNDYTFWQTKLPVDDYESMKELKHKLTFVFPKPEDKLKAKLVINAGTSLWGSQMIREMLSLYGNRIDDWYEKVDNLGGKEVEKENMMQFIVREQLYYLSIMIKQADDWKSQGLIFGGGPLLAETRTYDLDLSNVSGDSLVIQLNPPFGFWTLDYISVEYDEQPEPILQEIYLSYAIDDNNSDIRNSLTSINDDYISMPQVGDYFLVEFDAPPKVEGMERTIFLKTTGYYELHLSKANEMQTQTLHDIVNIPGEAVRYAMRLFESWSLTAK